MKPADYDDVCTRSAGASAMKGNPIALTPAVRLRSRRSDRRCLGSSCGAMQELRDILRMASEDGL
jgi:hypothetical protein